MAAAVPEARPEAHLSSRLRNERALKLALTIHSLFEKDANKDDEPSFIAAYRSASFVLFRLKSSPFLIAESHSTLTVHLTQRRTLSFSNSNSFASGRGELTLIALFPRFDRRCAQSS